MKPILPLSILTAVLTCVAYAQDNPTSTSVTNPADGGFIGGTANGGPNCNIYIAQDVTWTTNHNYNECGVATLLSVGCHAGAGSLTVADDVTVNVDNCLYIGGSGYQFKNSGLLSEEETLQTNKGAITVGKNATLAIGVTQTDAAGAQLHVGSSDEGTLDVKGGTVITNYLLSVGEWAGGTGTMTVTEKGNIEVRLPSTITTSFGSNNPAKSSCFYIGLSEGTGKVTLDDSTLSVTAEGSGRYGQTYVGLGGKGTLELTNGANADLGYMTIIGYRATGYDYETQGTITVDGSTLSTGYTFVGYGDKATLDAKGGSLVKATELYVSDTVTVTASTLKVTGDAEVYATGKITLVQNSIMEVGGNMTVEAGAKVTVDNTSTLSVAGTYDLQSNSGDSVTVGEGSNINSGTMSNSNAEAVSISLETGASLNVAKYENNGGNTTVKSATNANCYIGSVNLKTGNMVLTGDGKFTLGKTGEDALVTTTGSVFTIGMDESGVGSTYIDVTGVIAEDGFTLVDGASFTLNFTDEALISIEAGGEQEFSITLIKGFTDSEYDLTALLGNTDYNIKQASNGMLYMSLVEAEENAGTDTVNHDNFEVKNAHYSVEGSNLVWTGTIQNNSDAVPEPATASLSLLGLAALLLRRRRA